AAVAATMGDDAEGAAMVAAILHLDEGAGALRKAGGEMRRVLAHSHDVGDAHFGLAPAPVPARRRGERAGAKRGGIELLAISYDPIHLRHRREALGLDLRGAAGDADARVGPRAARLADRLAGLAHRLVGDGATVDDDEIILVASKRAHRLALGRVETAAQGDDLRPAHPPSPSASSPEKTWVAGPLMRIVP